MPSQHSPSLWAQKETKRLAHLSAGFVKDALPSQVAKMLDPDRSQVGSGLLTPALADRPPIVSDIDIPEAVEKGTLMTKISERSGKQKKVSFRIDPDEGKIFYESTKDGIVPIEAIKEIRTGPNAQYYREQFKLSPDLDSRWISIIYIYDGAYKTLHIVADSKENFDVWLGALQKLYAIRQGLMTGFGNMDLKMKETVWERQYWKGADEQADQVLEFDEIERLCRRLNVNLSRDEIRKIFKEIDTLNRSHLNFAQYQQFARVLKRRPELEAIYVKLASTNGGKITSQSKLDDVDLTVLFTKYAGSSSSPSVSPNEPNDIITLEDFSALLSSSDNASFSEQNKGLIGVSTIEGYIRALLHSCRSVELDIYDGETEPVIYHGKTLTSKVPLRDICHAVAKYGFSTSPYPVLISAEVHCGVAQQDKMVDIMVEVFGDSIVQAPVEDRPKLEKLPSVEDLRGKILLKAKNLYVVEQLAAVQAARKSGKEKAPAPLRRPTTLEAETPSPTSSDDETEVFIKEGMNDIKEGIADLKKTWKKLRGSDKSPSSDPSGKDQNNMKMSFRLASLLVYTVGVKCRGVSSSITYAPEHIFSLSENSVNKILKVEGSGGMKDLVKHTHGHLVRIYPKGTRVNSSNYEPHRYWAAGCQLVAINWQTFDLGYMINQAMFQRNGRSGYVLKPEALRYYLSAAIARYHDSDATSSVDPFVEVSLHIPDWSKSPFLPDSAMSSPTAQYSPPSDASLTSVSSARTVTFRTPVVKNNGFNPVWQEELCLPFDCVGDMRELIFVEFVVRQEGKEGEHGHTGGEPLGIYCVPLGCLEQGFRHLPLHDAQLTQHLFSTLFVQVNIRDIS
ncbi:PLC-like phosphodiesterase [Gymnopilus junonius]|uniref:Phosphoinositide phospholipase C n=1 Tax=Gymnopilus junonius TaxID=109634 RepID=A0A9P5NAQ3_GYMJU|nr:PLC-like phosphodiesterase [Gymnopilus junonius]